VHFKKIAGENSLKGQLQKPKHPLSGGEISLQLDRQSLVWDFKINKTGLVLWFLIKSIRFDFKN
jgi:hypothetical protein